MSQVKRNYINKSSSHKEYLGRKEFIDRMFNKFITEEYREEIIEYFGYAYEVGREMGIQAGIEKNEFLNQKIKEHKESWGY